MPARVIQDKSDFVEAIMGMSFRSLMQIAHELVSMVADADPARPIDTPVGMAEMLYDWAESQEEEE